MNINSILCTFIVLLSFSITKAQNSAESNSSQSKAKGKLAVSFDDELISGKTDLPAGELIQNRLNNRYKRMIKIRKDFIQDVENSKDDFKNH